ncbi:cytochrome c oxidase subunit 2 [Halopenitus malekzadehii]|uniref:Cytochrome c oxidase subunit 2 n=1 Tax=Halopenitus malekzadehii TaxID=1267564 RepID=A0A1H6HSA3_9EURY|nr:cytochrome c oxidase subunit II [Halopenitus malekzadehii]SEH37045.1 cytochrome c oxidase subunit 2 [Halopenitus malekzadehii]
MHVHSYEKIWLALGLGLILLLIGSVTYGAVGPGVSMVAADQPTVDPTALDEDDRFAEPRVEQVGENEYEAYVVAYQFGFEPDPIVIPANSTVTFMVTSRDVTHGFEVVGTNANTMVIPGEVSTLTVETGGPTEYGVICNEYCGAAHHGMEATIEVVPQDEFESSTGGSTDSGGSTDGDGSGGDQ